MENIIEHEGKQYLKVGDKALEISSFDKAGKPIIKVESVETPNENGGTDVTISVPCLKIVGDNNK